MSTVAVGALLDVGDFSWRAKPTAGEDYDLLKGDPGDSGDPFWALRIFCGAADATGMCTLILPSDPSGADPDIAVSEGIGNQAIPFLAVEVKGGRDASNAFNRAGEAGKSHIAATRVGYRHRWTIFQLMGIPHEQIMRPRRVLQRCSMPPMCSPKSDDDTRSVARLLASNLERAAGQGQSVRANDEPSGREDG